MPVIVGGKPPKKRFKIKPEWLAIGLGIPLILLLSVFKNASELSTQSTPQASPNPSPTTSVSSPSPSVVSPSPSPQVRTPGIGISRTAVQSVFEHPEIGFNFQPSSNVRGQPRIMGTSRNGLAAIELIGPSSELVSASIMVGIPNDNAQAINQNVVYTLGFIKHTAPDWSNGSDWFTSQITALANSDNYEASTTFSNKQAHLTLIRELGVFTLTIKPL